MHCLALVDRAAGGDAGVIDPLTGWQIRTGKNAPAATQRRIDFLRARIVGLRKLRDAEADEFERNCWIGSIRHCGNLIRHIQARESGVLPITHYGQCADCGNVRGFPQKIGYVQIKPGVYIPGVWAPCVDCRAETLHRRWLPPTSGGPAVAIEVAPERTMAAAAAHGPTGL